MSEKKLPDWDEIKKTHPDLAKKLQTNRNDIEALKEYLRYTLGAEEIK